MTDAELIDRCRDYAGPVCNEELSFVSLLRAAADRLEQLTAPPPEGSVRVRIAACSDGEVYVEAVGVDRSCELGDATMCARREVRLAGYKATHAATITAWLPPIVVPDVEGRVEP